MRKYKFIGLTEMFYGYKMQQIQAVRDFGNVKKGEVGGWVCYDGQLSHDGDCWVGFNSRISYNICVCDNAQLFRSNIFGSCVVGKSAVLEDVNTSVFGRIYHTIKNCDNVTSIIQTNYDICYSGYEIVKGKKEHYISVGCQVHKVSDWLNETFRNKVIRAANFPKSKVESFLYILMFICKEHRIKI